MAKKTHIKVRLVPETKPDSPFFYYVKKILNSRQSNNLDEISNKSIRTDNLRNKISNISQIVKDLKKLK